MRHRPAPSPSLAAAHLIAAALCLASPLMTFLRYPGHFITRLFSPSQLSEDWSLVLAAVILCAIGIGLLRRSIWVGAMAMAVYWLTGTASAVAFVVGAVCLAGSQMNPPVRPFGVDIYPLAAFAIIVVSAIIVVPAFTLAIYFTRITRAK